MKNEEKRDSAIIEITFKPNVKIMFNVNPREGAAFSGKVSGTVVGEGYYELRKKDDMAMFLHYFPDFDEAEIVAFLQEQMWIENEKNNKNN